MDQSVSNLPAGTNLNGGAAVGSPSREYIYGGGALLAKIDSSGTKYYHQDHLSNRLVTDSSGNTLTQMGHFPFGESWYNATGDKLLFTTYERDAESGNDYAQARYYVNRLALFSALDPLSGSTMDPQTLNRYDYVRDDSIDFLDPTGQFRAAVCIIPAYANCGLGGGVGWSGSWEGELIDFAFTPTGTGWEGDPFLDNLGALGLLGDPGVGGGCTGPLMTGCLVNGACQRP
jgi:RHS repeat-associated protein